MKRKILYNLYFPQVFHWLKLISVTGLVQLIVQAVGFLSGILVIRLLPIEEYAFYTLANTALGTMVLLTDGGISAGVLSQGGKVWQDAERLGAVVATGLDLRKKFAAGSLIVSVPILLFLLIRHDASWLMAILITVSLIPIFYAELSSNLLEIPPKLHQHILPLQKNDGMVGIGRLILTVAFIFLFPFAFMALLANGFPRIYGNKELKKISADFVAKSSPDLKVRKEILATVKKMMPGVIYYCLSGQITVWLLSFFGNTQSLAQIGALSRLAVVLGIFNTLIGTLIIPRFARLANNKMNITKFYARVIFAIIIPLSMVVGIVYSIPSQILWLLGKNYSGLQLELLLMIIGSSISLIAGVAFSLNISRNWIINPVLSISISIASILVGALLFDVSQLIGILYFNIFLAVVQFIINFTYGVNKINKLKFS